MKYDALNPESIEKYSSAVSLSDMEIFIFPEIMYALVLANIMSPSPWNWKKASWFKKLPKMNEYRKLQRTKQFIMDNFVFNLDLDTWGMTTKPKELERFDSFINLDILKNSNALFGYEGDKYYFDIDIRRHFGLDKYNSDVIPYWKTETIEAMEAFKHKEGYTTGAGECVSFSTLYAAALFVIAGIPLERIHLFATPLHSQNFVDIRDGVVTNNRRLVTKNMWFNGTELSAKARRALENEKVTMVVNNRGYVHNMYKKATMPQEEFTKIETQMKQYLTAEITYEILASFLREQEDLQSCFQLSTVRNGKRWYIGAETVYHYEHGSKSRVGTDSHKALLSEIDIDEFYPEPLEKRLDMDSLEQFFQDTPIQDHKAETLEKLKEQLDHVCYDVEQTLKKLLNFSCTEPRLPEVHEKEFEPDTPIEITPDMSRDEVIAYLKSIRETSHVADLAFMALRDMSEAPWLPFLKAAFERNPVCIAETKELSITELYQHLDSLPNESIYPETRFAQPDEVWNFGRGEGLEKAITFATILNQRTLSTPLSLSCDDATATVSVGSESYPFYRTKSVAAPTATDWAAFL